MAFILNQYSDENFPAALAALHDENISISNCTRLFYLQAQDKPARARQLMQNTQFQSKVESGLTEFSRRVMTTFLGKDAITWQEATNEVELEAQATVAPTNSP